MKFYRHVNSCHVNRDAPPEIDDVRSYAAQQLSIVTTVGAPQRDAFASRLAAQSHGIFLYASLVLDELAQRPAEFLTLSNYHLPDGMSGLYHAFLNRELGTNERHWFEHYEPLLGLMSVAQGEGLTAERLDDIIGKDIRAALRTCKQYLIGQLPDGPFQLFHKSFADFLLEDEQNIDFHIDAKRWHKTITDYYHARFSGRWADCDPLWGRLSAPSCNRVGQQH